MRHTLGKHQAAKGVADSKKRGLGKPPAGIIWWYDVDQSGSSTKPFNRSLAQLSPTITTIIEPHKQGLIKCSHFYY